MKKSLLDFVQHFQPRKSAQLCAYESGSKKRFFVKYWMLFLYKEHGCSVQPCFILRLPSYKTFTCRRMLELNTQGLVEFALIVRTAQHRPTAHSLCVFLQVLPPDVYTRLKTHLAWVKSEMKSWVTEDQQGRGLYADYLFSAITGRRVKSPELRIQDPFLFCRILSVFPPLIPSPFLRSSVFF
jgi:hypothetical protein